MTAAELHSRLSSGAVHWCMGLRLQPLTLGHMRALDHLGCGEVADPSALGLAVLVCSQPQARINAYLRSWLMPIRLAVWRLYLREWDYRGELEKFRSYIRHHTELPVVSARGPANGEPPPIPAHQTLRVLLLSRLGYSPDTIDETRYLQALWDVATLNVINGSLTMMDMDIETLDRIGDDIDWDKAAEAVAKAV